jgi:hypothetical protein
LNIEIHEVNLTDPQSIISGIRDADEKNHDVIVLTRGGGSDLYLFNDRAIVSALSTCRTFTITGIGHSNDRTDCDEVADLSVETPSSAGAQIKNWVAAKHFAEKNKAREAGVSSRSYTRPQRSFFEGVIDQIARLIRKVIYIILSLIIMGTVVLILSVFVRGCLVNSSNHSKTDAKTKVIRKLHSHDQH